VPNTPLLSCVGCHKEMHFPALEAKICCNYCKQTSLRWRNIGYLSSLKQQTKEKTTNALCLFHVNGKKLFIQRKILPAIIVFCFNLQTRKNKVSKESFRQVKKEVKDINHLLVSFHCTCRADNKVFTTKPP
jgi:hypothetical protein